MKTAVIAGGTGLVGSELLLQLLDSDRYARVIALLRRESPLNHPKLEKLIVDFQHLEKGLADRPADDVYCCLGTTMAKAGSTEMFYEVDFHYPLALAKATRAAGATQFLLVSALGAKKTSSIFYNKVKGETEDAVRNVGFDTLHIFRPSLLLGARPEKRRGEDAAKLLYKIFGRVIPRKFKAIEARTVAQAMIACGSRGETGVFVHESHEIQQYA